MSPRNSAKAGLDEITYPRNSGKASPSSASIRRHGSGGEAEEESLAQRRLTRQRRLRYVSDHELGIGHLSERSRSSPTSPESVQKLRWSPPGREHWSFSGVPQPLPLPDAPYFQKVSPPAGSCRKDTEQTAGNPVKIASTRGHSNRLYQDSNLGRSFAGFPSSPTMNSAIRSSAGDIMLFSRNHPNGSDHVSRHEIRPSEPLNLRVSVPSKSAPTSPAASPRRSSPADVSRFFMAPRDFSDPRSAGNSPPRCAVPRNALRGNRKPSKAVTFPPHHKSQCESSQAVPLPLPPGANCTVPAPAGGINCGEGPCLSSPPSMKGQWQKGKLIGRGTFGSVYLGTNKETGALCAMKEVDLIPDDPKSAECIKQLEQEIRVLRQLKHPNIVQYYGSEVIDDRFYIYLEYVYPGSINKYVREHCGAMTESVVRNFTRHILSGLAYLHTTKTIHRDIKGANLLVDASGVVKLADFGMAKHLTGHSYDLSLKGSPYWMAPEVIKAAMQNNGNSYLALAVDIWSLGCTIIEMFTGKPPWSNFTPPQAMFKVLNRTPPIPENLSSEGKDFLKCCFQRNPADRLSAAKLLEHAFVHNLHNPSVSPTTQSSYLVHIRERLQVHRDSRKDKFDFFGIANTSPPYYSNTTSPVTLSM